MERPSVAVELKRIHRTVTRALEGALEHARRYRDHGISAAEREPFAMYLQCANTLVHAHHGTEEDEAFPLFRDRIPLAPWDEMQAQHDEMDRLMQALARDVQDLRGPGDAATAVASAAGHLERLVAVWTPHIQIEEVWFSTEVMDRVSTPLEERSLTLRFAEHSKAHMVPGPVMLPFVLFHMPPEDRAHLERNLPWVLRKVLVPLAWRRRWSPIARYLPYAPGSAAPEGRRAA